MDEIQIPKKEYQACVSSFESILISNNITSEIKYKCLQGQTDKQKIRPTAWKLLLDIIPKDLSIIQWIETVIQQRIDYNKKKNKYLSTKNLIGHPLGVNTKQNCITTTDKPGWNSFFDDNEIKRIIRVDLNRTFQEIALFHQSSTILLLSNVLFIWAKENNDLSYKQGMNDLLSLIYVSFYPYYFKKTSQGTKEDLINNSVENLQKYSNELYQFFHDENELESDIYYVFCSLMKKGMKDLYINKINNTKEEKIKVISRYQLSPYDWLDSEDKDIPTPLYIRTSLIIKEKLRTVDDELCCYFKSIKLDTYVILQRWLKCIFIREFNYSDCCVLWDIIFANQESNAKYELMFIDYLAIAMIMKIREDLINRDENECLTLLFKYPYVNNIIELVDIAERVKKAINDKLNGKKIYLYDILPYPIRRKDNLPNQDNTSYQSQPKSEKTQSHSNSDGDIPPIQVAINHGLAQLQNNFNLDTEKDQMVNLLNNAWNSVGGFVTDIKSQVTKQIEKVNIDDIFNLKLQSPSSLTDNMNRSINAIEILENIYSKYLLKMDQDDQSDFVKVIEYYKKN